MSREGIGSRSLYLSPHFDDVALSCGGSVALSARRGAVTVATVFAGRPWARLSSFARFQHERWGTRDDTVDSRRSEDAKAMVALEAEPRWLDFPDAIYRGDLYLSDDDLFGSVKPADADIADGVCQALDRLVDELEPAALYLPLGVGGHVDHRLVRDAALVTRRPGPSLFLYEDFPYALDRDAVDHARASIDRIGDPIDVDVTEVFQARLDAIGAYASQLPTVFRHYGAWDDAVRAYARDVAGRGDRYAERFWQIG